MSKLNPGESLILFHVRLLDQYNNAMITVYNQHKLLVNCYGHKYAYGLKKYLGK